MPGDEEVNAVPPVSIYRSPADGEAPDRPAGEHPAAAPAPLLIDINGLAAALARSVPSLHRDDAAGRLPAAVRIGGSKRWRYADIVEWVALGCPRRAEFEARRRRT